MNVLDLFSGAAGGWSLGLHRAGFTTVAACEIDPWRRARYAENFPHVRLYDDVRTLTAERLRVDGIGTIDVVAGSPPCQDASTANAKGKGVDGERTGLFWEALRLVRELRPHWVLLENVPGLRTRGYDRVHDALETAGYAVRPLVVGAWHAGAPHRRNRVWIIANAPEVGRGAGRAGRLDPGRAWEPEQSLHHANAAVLFGPTFARGESNGADAGAVTDAHETGRGRMVAAIGNGPEPESGAIANSDENTIRLESGRSFRQNGASPAVAQLAGFAHWNGGSPDLGRVDDGLPKGMAHHMLAAYGDAVVPIIPELIGRAIMSLDK